jgi:hypothetical protein
MSVCLSVYPPYSAPAGRIFVKYICVFFEKSVKKIQASLTSEKNNGYFTWRQMSFMIISRTVLRMRNASGKSCRENRNTRFMFSSPLPENRPVRGITWKNVVEQGRPQMTIWRLRIACWITKAKSTLIIFYTYCFSMAIVDTRTRLIITLYVHCLSCVTFGAFCVVD